MKKGFTLIELLTVITLLGIISIIVMPKILEQFESKKTSADDISKQTIYIGAEEYIRSHDYLYDESVGYLCISLQTLVDNGNLVEPIIDVKTGTSISLSTKVELTYSDNQYKFEYNTLRCQNE